MRDVNSSKFEKKEKKNGGTISAHFYEGEEEKDTKGRGEQRGSRWFEECARRANGTYHVTAIGLRFTRDTVLIYRCRVSKGIGSEFVNGMPYIVRYVKRKKEKEGKKEMGLKFKIVRFPLSSGGRMRKKRFENCLLATYDVSKAFKNG